MANILIAEDDPEIRCLLGHILRQAGHEVTAVENGREALDRARAAGRPEPQPALVISDIAMPVLDGLTMAATLCSDKATAAIPVIIVSSKTCMREACRALPNIRAFLSKPFDPRRLVQAVGESLGGRSAGN